MRKHRKSTAKLLLASIVLTVGMGLTSYAAEWEQNNGQWQYEQDGGGYATGWQWIDGKCYYFDTNGYMAANTVIDGYALNASGEWTVDGVVQTQGAETGYNENGISNIAIDLLEHTRAENAAKYGEIRVDEIAGEYNVFYNDVNFIVRYYQAGDKPSYIKSYGEQAVQLFKQAPMTGNPNNDKDTLTSKGYSAISDGIRTVVDCGKYELQLQGSAKTAQVYIKFDYQ